MTARVSHAVCLLFSTYVLLESPGANILLSYLYQRFDVAFNRSLMHIRSLPCLSCLTTWYSIDIVLGIRVILLFNIMTEHGSQAGQSVLSNE